MTIGRWRIRPRWRTRPDWAVWMNRDRYPEGDVYRASIGWILITVMVDCMSQAQRNVQAVKLRRFMAGMTHGKD
jgi:hypothetical protein